MSDPDHLDVVTNAFRPQIADVVHYVAYGSADGTYPSACRAAVVTQVLPEHGWDVGLAVLNPTGMFFNPCIPHHPGDPAEGLSGARCGTGGRVYPGGTWHFQEVETL